MNINKEFSKAIQGLFVVSIFLYGLTIWMFYKDIYGFDRYGLNSNFRTILNILLPLIMVSGFWYAVFYVTKEKAGALIAFLVGSGIYFYELYNLLLGGFDNYFFNQI